MLDTHARHYLQPFFDRLANALNRMHITANQLTVTAFGVGVSAGVVFYFGYPFMAVLLLWLSGLLDVLDGSLARLSNNSSAWGGFMDMIFDRLVETGIIISYALVYPEYRLSLVILVSSIVFCISIFLTVGALAEKRGVKQFYHQAGFTERTETFIFFSLFFLFPRYGQIWVYVFAALIYFTGIQRFIEAYKLFGRSE